jgi:hypothetical protein
LSARGGGKAMSPGTHVTFIGDRAQCAFAGL